MLPTLRSKTRDTPRGNQMLRFREEGEAPQQLISPKSSGGTIISPRSTGRHQILLDPFPEDILGTFEASLRTYEERLKTSASEDVFNKPMVSGSSYINPEIEKNMKRVNLMVRRQADDLESRPTSRGGQKFTAGLTTNLQDKQYIDAYYPHPSTSRAVNRLPLPSSNIYDIPKLLVAAKKAPQVTKYYDVLPNTSLQDIMAKEKEFVLSLLPHTEEVYSEVPPTVREKKDSQIGEGAKVFWSIRQAAGQKPESREGTAVCWMDRKLYMFGGQSMTKRNEIRILNPDTWTWALLSTQYTPKGRIGHSITAYKKQIILFGGWSHYSQRLRMRRCFKKLYILFLEGEANWQRFRGEGKVPKSRRYHAAASFGSTLLVFGGVDTHSKVLSTLYALDMETFFWRKIKIPGSPGARSNCTLTPVFHPSLFSRFDFSVFAMPKLRMDQILPNSGFYLFGGLDDKAQPLNELWILGLFEAGLVWHKAQTTGKEPVPRSEHSAVMIGGYLAVFGGRNDFKANGSLCLGDISMLKIETLHWETVTFGGSVPPPRWSHVATVMGSKMIVFGGIDYSHFLPADLYMLETEPTFVTELLRQESEKMKEVKLRVLRRMTKNIFGFAKSS